MVETHIQIVKIICREFPLLERAYFQNISKFSNSIISLIIFIHIKNRQILSVNNSFKSGTNKLCQIIFRYITVSILTDHYSIKIRAGKKIQNHLKEKNNKSSNLILSRCIFLIESNLSCRCRKLNMKK